MTDRLLPSQRETLAYIATLPDGAIASDIAHHFGISIRASEGRLERLARSGHLGLSVAFPDLDPSSPLCMYVLIDGGQA